MFELCTHSDAPPRHLRTPSPLPGCMNDISAVLLHLEAQRRDRDNNRQREADRRAAEQQAAEREAPPSSVSSSAGCNPT